MGHLLRAVFCYWLVLISALLVCVGIYWWHVIRLFLHSPTVLFFDQSSHTTAHNKVEQP